MEATSGSATASLEDDLLNRGHQFSFFQAMRLVGLMAENAVEGTSPSKVRVRPELSLAFPAADLARIEQIDDGYRLTATFLGLYGQASPLPTFYTEDLLEESAADLSASRDFIDIANHRLFALLYQCLTKYQLFFQVAQEEQEASATDGEEDGVLKFVRVGEIPRSRQKALRGQPPEHPEPQQGQNTPEQGGGEEARQLHRAQCIADLNLVSRSGS